MFLIIVSLLVSYSANAFEGQPKEIMIMPHFASKIAMTFADLKVSDLKQDKFTCRQSHCDVLATVEADVMAEVGDVQWRAKYARVTVGRDGQFQTPIQSSAIIFEEVETGNRLTMAIRENDAENRSLCFGKVGNNGRNCTSYKVMSNY